MPLRQFFLIRWIIAADAFIQRLVDAFAFFIMRKLGVRQRFIRYGMHAVIICSFAGDGLRAALTVPTTDRVSIFVWKALIIVFLFLEMKSEQHQDEQAEKKNMLSTVDAQQRWWVQAKKVLWFSLLVGNAIVWLVGKPNIFLMIYSAAFLFGCYLINTPNQPPPKEERKPVLVPAPSSA